MFSFICVWINDWVNNRKAGDLKHHRGHYDVKVMVYWQPAYHEQKKILSSRNDDWMRQNNVLFIIILSWSWWNLLTSANQIAQIWSCDRSRIHVFDLGGTGVWPGKESFHEKCKNLDDTAVHFITSLKSKRKNIQMKVWAAGYDNCFSSMF